MSTTSASPAPSNSSSTRPRMSKRASSSASFIGQLKHLQQDPSSSEHAPPESSEQVVIDSTGKPVKIRNSGVVHTLDAQNQNGASGSDLRLVATLFHRRSSANHNAPDGTDYISDMAIFEFSNLIDELLVPWKKWSASHKMLDSRSSPRVVEIKVSMPEMLPLADLRRHEAINAFENRWSCEVVLQPNDVWRRHKRLAVFDMDSTLIQQEVVDELADLAGVKDKVQRITERAMNGELDFESSLRERVKLLKGVTTDCWEKLKEKITISPGAKELIVALRALGFHTAVLSGGFTPLADWLKEQLNLDHAYANKLVVESGELTGELEGDIVDAERKAVILEKTAGLHGIPLRQVIAIGDGANDLKMMERAGLGVAYNAKPHVQQEAPCRLNTDSLVEVLYLLGLDREEIAQLGASET